VAIVVSWRFILVLLCTALAASGSDAHAGDVARARKVFAEGVRLYQAGDWDGARRLFREAEAEHHAPAIVYNIGLAEEKLGHPQAAVAAYEAYVAESGEKSELAPAAAAAIAQIKAKTTKLVVETRPSGSQVFLDGAALESPSPVTLLVRPGPHLVMVLGDGWSEERKLDAAGTGDTVSLVIEAASPSASPTPRESPLLRGPPSAGGVENVAAPPSRPSAISPDALAPPVAKALPDGLVWGATFAILPVYLLGVSTPGANNAKGGLSIVAGPMFELGFALTERFEFLARALVGLGPDGKPSYDYMGGPGLSYRVGPAWLGASFLGGQLETRVRGVRYGTDLVFGGMLEASVVVVEKPQGEWLVGIQPSVLLTEMRQDNTAVFFPVSFGYRAY
jgi:hypothetical protein